MEETKKTDFSRKQVILVVDDNPDNIAVLAEFLRPHYQVKAATNGAMALKIASSSEPPDLILLDIMMPELDGYSVCEKLKASYATKKIPVIFVTAMGDAEDETKGLALGAVDFISKPVRPSIVKARIKTHLRLYDQNRDLEEMVRQRTERLETLLAAVPDVIFHFNKTGDYLDFQAKSGMELYAQPSEFLGKNILDVFPRREAEQFMENIKKTLATGRIQLLEYRIPVAGIRRYREARFIAGEAQDAFIIIRDITERKLDEACDALLLDVTNQLLAKESVDQILTLICDRLVEIFDLSQAVVGLKETDGTVKMLGAGVYASHAEKGIIGRWDEDSDRTSSIGMVIRTGKPLIGQTKADLLPWQKATLVQWGIGAEWLNSFATFPLRVEGSVIGGLSLTSRYEHFWNARLINRLQHFINQAAIAIRASEDRQRLSLLHAGLNAAANAIVITNIHGKIQWTNPSFSRLTGYALDEVVDQNPRILKSGQQDETIYRQLWETITAGNVWQGELINRRKDGSIYIEEMTITPVKNERDEIVNFIAIKQDITERLQAQKAILAAREAQSRAEKFFTIGTMAGGIAHEINQPLNSIKLISSGLVFSYQEGKTREVAEYIAGIQEISRQADRINKIVSHLRSFIRQDKSQMQPCSLNTAIEQSLEIIGKQLLNHGIAVKTFFQPKLPFISAVPTGLEEIIVNLLVNAMQALDTLDKRDKNIQVSTWADEAVILEVADNGPGIPDDLTKTIFEPFVSTKTGSNNLGLGLSIVSAVISSFGGIIQVISDGKSGTTFRIQFPINTCDGGEG